MVDDIARRRLAELARHLTAGRITNDDFEDKRPSSSERALHDIYFHGCGLCTTTSLRIGLRADGHSHLMAALG
jgi:hypothetical protein